MINSAITKLIQYGLNTGLVDPRDKVYTTNAVLEVLKLEEYEAVELDGSDIDLEEVLTSKEKALSLELEIFAKIKNSISKFFNGIGNEQTRDYENEK